MDETPNGFEEVPPAASSEPAWSAPPPGYVPPAGYVPPPGYTPPPPGYPPTAGLTDNTAGALAYVTIIPAIIFLLLAPYNERPFVKFHAIQSLGLAVVMFVLSLFLVIPILGWLVYILGFLAVLVLWILCIVKASQGGAYKLPVIGNFAAQQAGYKF